MRHLPFVVRSAAEHGWLRRPELDTSAGRTWELPDGKLVLIPHPSPPPYVPWAPTKADRAYLHWLAAKRRGQITRD